MFHDIEFKTYPAWCRIYNSPNFSEKFQIVDSFFHLGSLVNSQNKWEDGIIGRIVKTNKCYYGLRNHYRRSSSEIYLHNFTKNFDTARIMTHGSEEWVLT